MILATLLAGLLGMVFQGISLNEATTAMATGYVSSTGVEQLDKLLTRGGMMSMMYVTLIAFCAFAFAGIMQATGMLKKIMDQMLNYINSTGSLVLST